MRSGVLWVSVALILASAILAGLPVETAAQGATIEVQPEHVVAHAAGETFSVDIVVKDLDPTVNTIGIQFALVYNLSILEFVEYKNGTFMDQFVNNGEQGVLNVEKHDFIGDPTLPEGHNKVFFMTMILPDEDGKWHEPFPGGSGTLCTITFKVVAESPVSAPLTLSETKILNVDISEVPHTTKDGLFELVAPRPAEFSVSNLKVSPREAKPGETVTISVDVTNVGETSGSYTVTLKLNGVTEATKEVTLDPGASTTVEFTVSKDAGTYYVEVDGLAETLRVVAATPTPPPPPPMMTWLPYIAIIIVIVIAVAAAVLIRR